MPPLVSECMLLHFPEKMRATFKAILYKSCGALFLLLQRTKNWKFKKQKCIFTQSFSSLLISFRNAAQKSYKKVQVNIEPKIQQTKIAVTKL